MGDNVIVSNCYIPEAHEPHRWIPALGDPTHKVGTEVACPGIPAFQSRHPVRAKLTHRETIVALDKYITDLHTQTWPPMQWLVYNDERRELAIDWFVNVCEAIGLIETTQEAINR